MAVDRICKQDGAEVDHDGVQRRPGDIGAWAQEVLVGERLPLRASDGQEGIEEHERCFVAVGCRSGDIAQCRGVLAHQRGDAIAELLLDVGRGVVSKGSLKALVATSMT